MRKKIFFLLLIFPVLFFAQNSEELNSLLNKLDKSKSDTDKVNILLSLVSLYQESDNKKAVNYAEEAVKLGESSNFKLNKCYEELAWLYKDLAEYKKSLSIYFKAEKNAQNLNSPQKEKVLGKIHLGLASVYGQLNNYDLAIEKVKLSIKYFYKIKDSINTAYSTLNLGNYYYYKTDYKNSLLCYYDAEKLFIKNNDTSYLPNIYNNIAGVLYQLKEYEKALSYYNKFYNLIYTKTPDDLYSTAIALQNIGQTEAQLGNYKVAIGNCLSAVDLFKKLNDIRNVYNTYENIAGYYAKLEDYKSSNKYYSDYVHLKDSIFDEDTKTTIHEMSVKYESEKKEQENQLLTLENKNKSQVIYFALGGCALLFGLLFFIYRGYRNKQKANLLLEEKNNIIQHQKEIVEEQHQDITDSIKYAKRIQGAILPPRNLWTKILPESFVLYMPKDVLSGDFYWIEETKDYIYVAAADCTGHGVPGALISIVNYNLLNKAILEKGLVTPSEILDSVNLWLTESLHQTYRESAVRDGMDVTLIAIHKHSNEVLFAGANNPIYLVSNGELKQIKGDKFPVGAFIEDQIQHFTTKSFKTQPGDCIYMFSDGFADQFGGDNGKKYKYAPFQRKLIDIYSLPLSEQRNIMRNEFLKWKGSHEQVDDVLLVGIKIA